MKKEYTIGIFDSGKGGLTILDEIEKILPEENIIYIDDSKNNPYGSKDDQELLNITTNIVDYLIKQNCKIIVIACNTATTRCITNLRSKYPNLIFVGTEPPIKMACDQNYQNILILGTHATVTSKNIFRLIKNNKKDFQTIYIQDCEGLANAIETNNTILINTLLKKFLTPYQDKNIDGVVIGCTHYSYIKDSILKYFPNAKIFDSIKGVAKETKRQLLQNNLQSNKAKGIITIKKNA